MFYLSIIVTPSRERKFNSIASIPSISGRDKFMGKGIKEWEKVEEEKDFGFFQFFISAVKSKFCLIH